MTKPLFITALLLPFLASAQVYKCEVDGVLTFSQQPCAEDAELTKYTSEPAAPPPSTTIPQPTESYEEANARIAKSIRQRNINIEITKITAERNRKQRERDQRIAQLRRTKQSAANNLAGATLEESLSKEMSAIAMQYDTDIRSLDAQIDRLREDLKRD